MGLQEAAAGKQTIETFLRDGGRGGEQGGAGGGGGNKGGQHFSVFN